MDKWTMGTAFKWKNLLSYNHVSVILPDADRIWFGTYFYGFGGGGISYYHPQKTPPWKTFNTNNGIAKKIVSMAVDGEWLWVGSEKGLSLLDKKTEAMEGFLLGSEWPLREFRECPSGRIRFPLGWNQWRDQSFPQGQKNSGKPIAPRRLDQREKSKPWRKSGRRYGREVSDGSLFEYDPDSDRWKKIEPTDPLRMEESIRCWRQREGFHLPGQWSERLRPSTGHWDSITASDGLLSNSVFCAAEDKNGVWFGTDKGASRLMLTP